MKTKTCGECRYFEYPAGQCAKVMEYNFCHGSDNACEYFEPKVITIGDRIRKMSNGVLAFMITRLLLDGCPISKSKNIHDCEVSNDCVSCLKRLLNAPAESDVCVAQNAKNDTQTDLCCTDDTESEVEE